jgi:hypothetical protein
MQTLSPDRRFGTAEIAAGFIDQLRFRLPAAVRREIWGHQSSFMSRPRRDTIEIPRHIWERMENALAYAA